MDLMKELPPRGRPGRPLDPVLLQFASELKAHPGEWAAWPKEITDATRRTLVTNIRNGNYAAFPPAEFEAAQRDNVVYVRAL